MRNLVFIGSLFIQTILRASDPYPRNEAIDVRHYQFTLELNDTTDIIAGVTEIGIRFKKSVNDFELDLAGADGNGNGMVVKEVLRDLVPLKFTHQNDRLKIILPSPSQPGMESKFIIRYGGIPAKGLIISKNKFGARTFFGDNWPNRAHFWLPVIDHPYDKATCEFIVTAPEHYSVIATGEKIEESALSKNRKLTHWKTAIVLPVKVMTMGVARFAISYEGNINNTSLETWVYPQNRLEGFSDFAIAARPLDYFSKSIAPYPYEKLANVQSTTYYGGMENAGNIFYAENLVTGKGKIESLIAHEIAHQWFGNSASEADWHHVWLSEGFATYFANLYFENSYGSQRFREEMQADRNQVVAYFKKDPTPVVNPSIVDITRVLNTNSYQKASWVLHMLRHETGDQKFWEGIRNYYRQYQLGNALTDDFRKVMETVSGKDLSKFFNEWIFNPGHPNLSVHWQYLPKQKLIRITVEQRQEYLFDFPLEIEIQNADGGITIEKNRISLRKQELTIPFAGKPASLVLDPEVWLLFEGQMKELSRK